MIGRRAFTLVELLIVVVIIAVLAALVFFAMAPVRESSRRTTCGSNLRQISQALRMYMDDFEGVEPEVGVALTAHQLGLPLVESIGYFKDRYARYEGIFFCPSYHREMPLNQLTMTYTWFPEDTSTRPGPYSFAEIVRKKGPHTPVLACEDHNFRWSRMDEPRWTQKRITVLRLGGAIEHKHVGIQDPSFEW
jgi:prepilin-type N-terminal cleavage/methylation domain-containing protein